MLKACDIHVINCSSPRERRSKKRNPRRAVFFIALFLTAVSLFAGCSQKTAAPPAAPISIPVGPDQVFVDARFVVTENGATSAVISADSVMVFQQNARSVAEGNLRILFFSRDGVQISTLTADRGIVYGMTQAIDSLRAEGNVVVVWHERNARMDTPFIRWISATRRIFADSTVALTVDEAVEKGKGLEAPDDLKSYTMRQVTGSVVGQEIKIPGRDEKAPGKEEKAKADSSKTTP